ncbi:hypothetical protein DL768_000226 [Monosporascus sp. mg162]|nr:hypothetical protein DL768_000226 [Monosporascus sp. mg162]
MDNGNFQGGMTTSQGGSSYLDSESTEESQQFTFFTHTPFGSQEIQFEPDRNQFDEHGFYPSNTGMTFSPGMMPQNLQPGSSQLPYSFPGHGMAMPAIGPVANGYYDDVMLKGNMESQQHAHCDATSYGDSYDYISSSQSSDFSDCSALGPNVLQLDATDGDTSTSGRSPIQVVAQDPDRNSSSELSVGRRMAPLSQE